MFIIMYFFKLFICISRLQHPPVWEGPLAKNDVLLKAERLFNDQIIGPESLVVHEGELVGSYSFLLILASPTCMDKSLLFMFFAIFE